FFFFQGEDGIRDRNVTGVQTCALPIYNSIDKAIYRFWNSFVNWCSIILNSESHTCFLTFSGLPEPIFIITWTKASSSLSSLIAYSVILMALVRIPPIGNMSVSANV